MVRQPPFPQRYLDVGRLDIVRIEVDRNQYHVAATAQPLAIVQDLSIERRIEGDPQMALQRWMRPTDPVQRGDLTDDIARRREVSHANLVLLGIYVFLPPRQWCRLAELEARIHPPQPRQSAGQRGADQEPRTS